MSLTRKGLKAMGLTEEQVDSIIEAHSETVDGLKDKLKTAQENADKLTSVQAELDELKAKNIDGYKEKYETVQKELENFKKAVADKETKAAKEKAARAYFAAKDITGENLDIAMLAAAKEIADIELDGDKIKDSTALDALTNGSLASLATKTVAIGAQIAHPPTNNGSTYISKSELYKKDEKGNCIVPYNQRIKGLVELHKN